MVYETIDTHDAISVFHQLMQPDSEMRLLRLVGHGKMGKSHLLMKVFPVLAQKDYHARYATLDLRNSLYRVPDILQMACSFIGAKECAGYNAAYQAWITRSRNRSSLEVKGIRALFSFLRISME